MFEKMLVITGGLTANERARIVEAFGDADPPLVLSPLTNEELDSTIEDVAKTALSKGDRDGTETTTPWPFAFLALFPRSRIDDFIASFKSAVDRRGVFASLTPTNGDWTWRYLIEHLSEEHEEMMRMERRKGGDQ